MKYAIGVIALVLAAGCQKGETPAQAQARMQAEADSVRAMLDQHIVRFARYQAQGNVDSLLAEFTSDAVMMPPNAPAVRGQANLRRAMTAMLAEVHPTARYTVEAVSVNGPLAVEEGRYHLTFPAAQGRPAVSDSGKYLVHWRKVDGRWLIAHDMWNSDIPLAPTSRR